MNSGLKQQILEEFIDYCKQRLGIEGEPDIQFINNRDWTVQHRSFGAYDPNTDNIIIYVSNRNLADILRTLAHELVHHRQRELGKISDINAGKTGSEIENQANALAGILMRDYGRTNDLIYESKIPSLGQIYKEIIKSNK